MVQIVFERYKLTNAFFQDASDISNEKGKKLLVIGDPCGGTYFQFVTKYFLDYGHGDVTIDLFGCEKCTRMDINDMEALSTFEDDSFVVMETGTLSFSKDIRKVLTQIKRISGGEFLSAGSTHGFLWENFTHKTYDKNLNYTIYPFDFRKDFLHKSKSLHTKELFEIEFMKL
tara:strand:- start:190 stop:705 length:516 start_codon:yes stop_codon:yes gene_type:complete